MLIYSKLKEKTHCQNKVSDFPENQYCHLSFSQFVIVKHNSRKKNGLASVFSLTCAACGTENVAKTSGEHSSGQTGPISHDVSSRAAPGCLHTGICETHLNNLLRSLNIPSMNPLTFKSRENEIGHEVVQVTKKSCKSAMSEERNAAIKKSVKADDQGCINVPCTYDMGWQKRGKGHNLSTGQAAVMGLTYGKVMDYTTRKSWRVFTNGKKTGKEAKHHNCRLNRTASSKAMEPMTAVHLFTESLNSKVKLSVYVGDEDSTKAAHIKQKVPYPVKKWTEIVHAKRSLTTRLYNLSQYGKFVNSSTLLQKVINYLVKCFTYSVSQNKGNPSALQKILKKHSTSLVWKPQKLQ